MTVTAAFTVGYVIITTCFGWYVIVMLTLNISPTWVKKLVTLASDIFKMALNSL